MLYLTPTNYFSVSNFLALFGENIKNKEVSGINMSFQNTLEHYTFSSITTLKDFFLNEFVIGVFNIHTIPNLLELRDLNYLIQYMFMNLKIQTELHYNVDLLRYVFPTVRNELEMFEVLSYDIDGSLYNSLSTPNVKLYYPEPFIASPSFAHEDI